MVLLSPWYILQMGLIRLHALVIIQIPFHLIYVSGKSHSLGCQPFEVDLYDGIFVATAYKAFCFLDVQYPDDMTQ